MITKSDAEMWEDMVSRSFQPRQWYERDDAEEVTSPGGSYMWVYLTKQNGTFSVGYFDPKGEWHEDGIFSRRQDAAVRVHWLNGGLALPNRIDKDRRLTQAQAG